LNEQLPKSIKRLQKIDPDIVDVGYRIEASNNLTGEIGLYFVGANSTESVAHTLMEYQILASEKNQQDQALAVDYSASSRFPSAGLLRLMFGHLLKVYPNTSRFEGTFLETNFAAFVNNFLKRPRLHDFGDEIQAVRSATKVYNILAPHLPAVIPEIRNRLRKMILEAVYNTPDQIVSRQMGFKYLVDLELSFNRTKVELEEGVDPEFVAILDIRYATTDVQPIGELEIKIAIDDEEFTL
jgi:hypothetical protein